MGFLNLLLYGQWTLDSRVDPKVMKPRIRSAFERLSFYDPKDFLDIRKPIGEPERLEAYYASRTDHPRLTFDIVVFRDNPPLMHINYLDNDILRDPFGLQQIFDDDENVVVVQDRHHEVNGMLERLAREFNVQKVKYFSVTRDTRVFWDSYNLSRAKTL